MAFNCQKLSRTWESALNTWTIYCILSIIWIFLQSITLHTSRRLPWGKISEKTLRNFEKFKKLILIPKMTYFLHFGYNRIFHKNPKLTYTHFLNTCHQVQFYKNLMKRLQKCQFWAKKWTISLNLSITRIFLKNPK